MWTKLCYAYCRIGAAEHHAPRPLPGQSKEQYEKQMSDRMHLLSDNLEILAKREELLKPPSEYETFNNETVEFYRTQSKNWLKFSQLAMHPPTKEGMKFVDEMFLYPVQQINEMRQAAKKTSNDAALEQQLGDMERANPLTPAKS